MKLSSILKEVQTKRSDSRIILKEYSQKLVDQLISLYQPQTNLGAEQIKNYINRFNDLKAVVKQKFEKPETRDTIAPLIPADLQEKNKYLDITLWKDFNALKRLIDGTSKKDEDIYKQMSKYYMKKNPELAENTVNYYVNRFKTNLKNLEQKVKVDEDQEVINLIPKHLLDGDRYLIITNWLNFGDLEHLIDAVFPQQQKGGGEKVEMNTAETDGDLIYDKDNIQIFQGDSEHKCIRYGKNQYYGWCISRKVGSLYTNYRFGRNSDRGLMFYFIFDRDKSDGKDPSGKFTDPYHAVVIHALDNGKYMRTNAQNGGDEPSGGTSWKNLGEYFPGKGQALWNKIKGLESLFKYIPPSKEEQKQFEYKNKKLTLAQFSALPKEDKTFWLRANSTDNNIVTPEITKTLDAQSKNDLINHGKRFSYAELQANQGLVKRYADYRFTRNPDEPLPYIFIPYLKEELQKKYFDKFQEEYTTFPEIEKYFSKNILDEYIDDQIKKFGFLPKEAVKHMNESQEKLYEIYSVSFENLNYIGEEKDLDNSTQAPERSVQLAALTHNIVESIDNGTWKKWIALVKKLGSNISNIEKYTDFFYGIPPSFLIDSKLYFFSSKAGGDEYCIFGEDKKVILDNLSFSIEVFNNKKELEPNEYTGYVTGINTLYIEGFTLAKFLDMDNKPVDLTMGEFKSKLNEAIDSYDYFMRKMKLNAGIIR